MKGTRWNGDATITKGMGSSRGKSMFSVGDLVAFETSSYCSPDGRQHSRGDFNPSKYLLQEEIELVEFDNSTYPGQGWPVGSMDEQVIYEMPDKFWHIFENQLRKNVFLLQILEKKENIFESIEGKISEVRNHSGKFLHIYEIPERFWACKGETFEETYSNILSQMFSEGAYETLLQMQEYRGLEMTFGVTSSGYYQPTISWGEHTPGLAHEYDSTRRTHHKIKVMPCVPNGTHSFYAGVGYPMSITFREGKKPSLGVDTSCHWANSQNWRVNHLQSVAIQKGWIFVDGKDVYDETLEVVSKLLAEQKAERAKKFSELSERVLNSYGQKVLEAVSKKRKVVLKTLAVLAEREGDKEEDVLKALSLTDDSEILANLLALAKASVSTGYAGRVADKAYAWAYLSSSLPKVSFYGNFDSASAALSLYAEMWNPSEDSGKNTLGDFFTLKGIRL